MPGCDMPGPASVVLNICTHAPDTPGMRLPREPVRLALSLLFFVMLVPFGYVSAGLLRLSREERLFWAIPIALVIVALGNIVVQAVWRFVNASTRTTAFFMHYNAERVMVISHVEAMISAGNYGEAAIEIESLLASHGLDAALCRLALDLHLCKFGSPVRAESLLRRMRNELPTQYESFATQRLIDLYMRTEESYPKALPELRRLIARFPNTPDAAGAEVCVTSIRAHLDQSTQAA